MCCLGVKYQHEWFVNPPRFGSDWSTECHPRMEVSDWRVFSHVQNPCTFTYLSKVTGTNDFNYLLRDWIYVMYWKHFLLTLCYGFAAVKSGVQNVLVMFWRCENGCPNSCVWKYYPDKGLLVCLHVFKNIHIHA